MSKMEKFSNWLSPLAAKMANQRHLVALRDSFIDISPIIMAASLFTLLNALIFNSEFINKYIDLSGLSNLALMVNNGTLGFITVFISFIVGYRLTKGYNLTGKIDEKVVSPIHAGVLGLALTMIMFPVVNSVIPVDATDPVDVYGVYLQSLTSSGGMFVGILCSILGTELLVKLARNKKLRISMPEGVPPAVSASFNSLIPECLTVIIFAVGGFTIVNLTGQNIPEIIQNLIAIPLSYAMESPIGLFLIQIATQLLWFFGLHGQNIVSSVTSAPMITAIQQNIEAFNLGQPIPNIVTNPWIDMYTLFGGTGAIMPLLISIFIFSKRKDYKEVGKIGFLPSLFNISEPIMFGLPVVMNPLLLIPFIFVPLINLAIAYPLTAIGLVGKSVVIAPWITPPILYTWLTTAGDIPATILTILLFIMDIFLYAPFIIVANKAIKNKKETKE